MSDVFISYARDDQPLAARLREVLEDEGWDVWWDQNLYAGMRWEDGILTALEETKVVLAAWSARSAASGWVMRELEAAHAAQKLVPCSLDGTLPPAPYDALEAALLKGWPRRRDHPELATLLKGIERFAAPSRIESVRPGFDFEFLDRTIGFPELPGVGDELPYLHFSVVINPARRLPWYVAYNVEAQTAEPGRRPDAWQPDPRMPRVFQPGNEHFLGTGFDRGHLAAPMTVGWGESWQAGAAMRQAFFWTNSSPQAPDVNRFSWLALEQRERELALERERVVGFSGPVLHEDDPAHSVTDELRGRVRARQTFHLPRSYWKVIVAPAADSTLQPEAYVVPNVNGREASRRCSIAELEALTQLVFPAALRD